MGEWLSLEGKAAIVTGGSRGIGKAVAEALAGCGASVTITGVSGVGLDETADRIRQNGGSCLALKGDVTAPRFAQELVARTKESFGSVDILVNNAGITVDRPLMLMSESDWSRVIDTNLTGVYKVAKAALRPMIQARSGRIINISSISGAMGREGQVNYSAAKAGLVGFTKALAREVGRHDILVNALVVGLIDTGMTRKLPRDIRKELIDLIPLGRIGRPEEVAGACLFLSSGMSTYVTGATLSISGGGYM
jgi:3-oxoacyl-[acyl-carrier protein] reductase